MSSQSSMHFMFDWAKARVDEMDAALAALEKRTTELREASRPEAEKLIEGLRRSRDEFWKSVKRHADATEAEWERLKLPLEKQWAEFEAQFSKYFEAFGTQIKHQQAAFEGMAAAQAKVCRETANRIQEAAEKFAADHRADLDAIADRIKADADKAQAEFRKLSQAGTASWTALNNALGEGRAAFDRAHQAARDALRRDKHP